MQLYFHCVTLSSLWTSSNCGSPCFVFLIRVTYNINPWWIIDCQWPSQHLNVERRYSNGYFSLPSVQLCRPLHPSKDWKVSPATYLTASRHKQQHISLGKQPGIQIFVGRAFACTQQKIKASQRAKAIISYLNISRTASQVWLSKLNKALLLVTLSWKQCF